MRSFIGTRAPIIGLLAAGLIGCGSNVDTSLTGSGGGDGTGATGSGASGGAGPGAGGSGGAPCTPSDEVCDGLDNDCDGEVDEPPCNCHAGAMQECYSGRAATKGVGECKAGTQTCDAMGTWGPCTGDVTPKPEECNTKDDDCNGTADDMGQMTCGVGACQTVVDVCTNGQPTPCTAGNPSVEICDGIDNDCDQQTDETFPNLDAVCDTGLSGVCAPGKTKCMNAAEVCVANLSSTNEICDGLDNDCDGTVDNNIPGTGGDCTTGQPGECSTGTISCQGGVIDCFPVAPASPELCDGLDNDCDGSVDQGDPEGGGACNTGQPGACAAGVEHCLSGAIACVPNNLGQPEVCNGLDDDCDGTVDDGNPGGGVPCGCGGTQNCIAGQLVCQGGPLTFFSDDFGSGNSKGWTLGPEWAIGPAAASVGCAVCPSNDPATDHTATADNGIAGVLIGACTPTMSTHPDYCMTSPIINTTNPNGAFLEFYRHLHSDYPNFMNDHVDVSTNGGATWTPVWSNPANATCINDTAWTKQSYDVTAYKSATFQFRICYNIGSTGVYASGSWNVDDVTVTSTACP